MWDLGATNGIVHIVDQILSDPGDETVDIGLTTSTLKSTSATKTLMSTSTTMSSMSAVSTTVPKISEPSVAVPIIG